MGIDRLTCERRLLLGINNKSALLGTFRKRPTPTPSILQAPATHPIQGAREAKAEKPAGIFTFCILMRRQVIKNSFPPRLMRFFEGENSVLRARCERCI